MRTLQTSRRSFLMSSAAGCLLGSAMPSLVRAAGAGKKGAIQLPVRWRDADGEKTEIRTLPSSQTAIVVCDMWNQHWCKSATRRCGEIAAQMAPLIEQARTAGVRIVHSPSDTLEFYKDHPARKRALAISLAEPPVPIAGWCSLDKEHEGNLPIDDSDGGCDCEPQCKQGGPWTRQHPAIEIADADFISDDGKQVYSYFVEQGIKNVLFMGVHTNMCVLGRSFGIRQMTRLGLNAVLVRDLTDTMYNPRMKPFVPHDEGTALVIAHVERHWCPTTASKALAKGLSG
jgi:nicotinamidase-related amidase